MLSRWGRRSFEERNRKSLGPFVSFLLLMSQTQVDTFCCFITFCMCVWVRGNDAQYFWWLVCLHGFWKGKHAESFFFSTTKLTKMLPASTLTVNLLLALVFSCASVPNFVCTFVLQFGLPLIVSGSSDCRIYFKLNRNVLLTILVLTDWQTLLPFWPSVQSLYDNIFNIAYKLKCIKMAEGRMPLCHGEPASQLYH